jgi:hypothetical protein
MDNPIVGQSDSQNIFCENITEEVISEECKVESFEFCENVTQESCELRVAGNVSIEVCEDVIFESCEVVEEEVCENETRQVVSEVCEVVDIDETIDDRLGVVDNVTVENETVNDTVSPPINSLYPPQAEGNISNETVGNETSQIVENETIEEELNETNVTEEVIVEEEPVVELVMMSLMSEPAPMFSIQSMVGGVAREGYGVQSGTYSLAGLDEYIPLKREVLDLDHAFIISSNMMRQANTTASSNGAPPELTPDEGFVSLYLHNTTHIRAQRSSIAAGAVVVDWQVLEAYDEEFTVQRGSHFYNGNVLSTTATIPVAVTPENVMSWHYVNTTYSSNNDAKLVQFYSDVTDVNTITFTRAGTSSVDVSFRWEVVEWNLSRIDNFVKGYTGAISGDDTTPDCIGIGTTVNKSSSILFHHSNSISDNDGGLDSSTRGGYIQDGSNICFYDYDGGETAGVKWYLIDFKETTGREESTMTAWGSIDYVDDVVLSGTYNYDRTLHFVSGTCNGDGKAKPRHSQWTYLTGATDVTGLHIERTYGGQNREYAWQVLELPYYENPESPSFSNPRSNISFGALNDVIRFSVDVADESDNVASVNGTIGGSDVVFTQGAGNEWYYDYTCATDGDTTFSFVESIDDGRPVRDSNQSVSVTITCDSIAPVVSFVSPDTPVNDSSIGLDYFDVNVSVVESNFKNITFDLYNSLGVSVESQTFTDGTRDYRFSGLSTGIYYYNVTVYDQVNQVGFTEIRDIYVDSENPLIEFSGVTLTSGVVVSTDTINIDVTVTEPNEANITFSLSGAQVREVFDISGRRSVSWSLLPEGFYEYNVTVYDIFGNKNFTETRNVTLDRSDPIVSYENGVEVDDTYFARNWIFVNVSYIESFYKNTTFELWNSTGLVANWETTSDVEYNFTGLSDAEYWYNVTICDVADNCGSSATQKITLDNQNPVVDFSSGTVADNLNFSRDWIFVDSVVIETNFENITFEAFMNGASVGIQTFTDGTREYNFTGLSSDLYDYNITVYDKAGNRGVSTTRTIGLDYVGPSISITSPQPKAYGNGTDMALTYSVNDVISSLDVCWFNVNDGVNTTVDCAGSSQFTVGDGQHTVKFYSNDTFGNLGSSQVTFLVSTAGPAVTLSEPVDDTFYSVATNAFFNYSTVDPDGVESCSLYGTWNGGWHLNQTDFSYGLIGDETNRSCSQFWGFDCGAWPTESGDNTFDSCDGVAGGASDEHVDNVYLSVTETIPGRDVTVTCEFDSYDAGTEMYIYYYNGATWSQLYSGAGAADGNPYNVSITFSAGPVGENHWVRCIADWDGENDECADTGSYYDNDDLNFTVVSAKEKGNFTANIGSEGGYEWNVECNDSNSYIGTAVNNYTVGVDLTSPTVNFGGGTLADNTRIGINSIFVDVSVVEANFKNITFDLFKSKVSEGSQTFIDNTRNYTFEGLSDGIYEYNITVYDKASRIGISTTRTIEVDTTKPSGSNSNPTDNYFTKEKQHNFTATVSDGVELADATLFVFNSTGGIVTTSLIVLSGLSVATIGVVYNFLYDDVFDWFYRIRDFVGNEYNTTSHQIEIDSTAPEITFIAPTEEDESVVLRDYITVNTSVYEKNYKNMTFRLYDSGVVVAPSPNTFTDATRSVNWTELSDGVYDYNVSSFDLAGNEGYSETRQIVLDTLDPVVLFFGVPKEDDSYVQGNSISIDVVVTEPNEKNITFSRYGQSSFDSSFVDGRRSVTWNLLGEGVYEYNVTVYDKVELKGSTETRKITIDNTNPIVGYEVGTEVDNYNASRNWIFVNVTVDELNFGNITFELWNSTYQVEGSAFSDGTRNYNFTGLSDGEYMYNVTVYDKAGNNQTTADRRQIIDTTLPVVSFVVPTESDGVIRNRDWVYLNSSLTELNFKEIRFSLYDSSGLYSEQTFSDGTRGYNFTGLPDDNYEYNISVYDWAGNLGSTESRTIGLDSAGPVVNIVKPKSKTYGSNESLPLEHSVYDKVSGLDTCWWNIDGGANQTITCNSATTFNTTVAPHTINFYANDTFGNEGYDSVSFFISITGPAIELVKPVNDTFYSVAQNVNFSFAASDPDSVDTCSLYGDWSGAWSEKETYAGTWYDVGYHHRKDIVITNSGSSALIDYPAYFNVPSEYTHAGDFTDLKFFNGSCSEEQTNRLAHDVEYYNSSSAHVWVKIPQVSLGSETVCMYYGNENSEEDENVTGVWNSNYGLVYKNSGGYLQDRRKCEYKAGSVG